MGSSCRTLFLNIHLIATAITMFQFHVKTLPPHTSLLWRIFFSPLRSSSKKSNTLSIRGKPYQGDIMVLKLKEHSSHALNKVTRRLEMVKLLHNSIKYLNKTIDTSSSHCKYNNMVLERVKLLLLYTFWKSIPG